MKKIVIFSLLVFLVGWIVPAWAQIQQQGEKGMFFNNETFTIKKTKLLKIDTSMTFLMGLDTTNSIYVCTDTAGKGATTTLLGTQNKKAYMADTLHGNPGAPFILMFDAPQSSSTDTLWIYGRYATDVMFDRFDSTAGSETIIWSGTVTKANSQRWSTKYWTRIDSFKLHTRADGLDSVHVHYRPFHAMVIADSLTDLCRGVLLGSTASGSKDSVTTKKWGYYVKRGLAKAIVSGNTTRIKVGDPLMVGNSGKCIPALLPVVDTVRVGKSFSARYQPGAKAKDFVLLGSWRNNPTIKDTLSWGAKCGNDSIFFSRKDAGATPTDSVLTGFPDSLTYMWIPSGVVAKQDAGFGRKLDLKARIIGRAVQQCTTDSTQVWIDFQP